MQRLLDAADMCTRENSGVSIDARERITLIDRDVPSSFQGIERLMGPGGEQVAVFHNTLGTILAST